MEIVSRIFKQKTLPLLLLEYGILYLFKAVSCVFCRIKCHKNVAKRLIQIIYLVSSYSFDSWAAPKKPCVCSIAVSAETIGREITNFGKKSILGHFYDGISKNMLMLLNSNYLRDATSARQDSLCGAERTSLSLAP